MSSECSGRNTTELRTQNPETLWFTGLRQAEHQRVISFSRLNLCRECANARASDQGGNKPREATSLHIRFLKKGRIAQLFPSIRPLASKNEALDRRARRQSTK